MKKFAVLLVLLLALVMVMPTYAYSGVSGSVYDNYGEPWQHGFTVYLIGTVSGSANQQLHPAGGYVISAGTSTFNVAFDTIPDDGTDVTVVIVFNDGGEGTPRVQQYRNEFTQFSFITDAYSLGNIDTGTGPLAVNLDSFGGGATNSLPIVAGLGLVMLAGVSIFALRRRQG